MRLKANDGRIVRLLHFRACSQHINLLLMLQMEAPNSTIEVRDEITKIHRTIPVFSLNLDRSIIWFLNPDIS